MATELPLQEDEDVGIAETRSDANQSSNGKYNIELKCRKETVVSNNLSSIMYVDDLDKCSIGQQESQNVAEKTEKSLKRQTSKSLSNYAVNGSVKIGSQDCSNTLTSMLSTEGNLPRSETIAAIGHRGSYTDDLPMIQSENLCKGDNVENVTVCRKCGHCMKNKE